jgi:hypothetical protein
MTHPQFRIDTLHGISRSLAKQLDRNRLLAAETTREPIADDAVLLRLGGASDARSLERLAALEGREVPQGRHLVAEVNGEIVAALPLEGGRFFADPFRPTAHLLPLMRSRAAQLDGRRRPRRTLGVFKGVVTRTVGHQPAALQGNHITAMLHAMTVEQPRATSSPLSPERDLPGQLPKAA